ncbi:hypothetical protein GCM10010991_37350 [Gemmobacter aquaticus]|uniref:Uncharacterized protein n=1 Tax=Gemmobacter aquaticus TaxID=490185 RepID=A0A918DE47_9RHOB|nr:hypothetical protein [Gemmobacter aquaticus]GGO39078.1 hypothetical protein GCM10010991_37350 [Gemmobacter aquaticus]
MNVLVPREGPPWNWSEQNAMLRRAVAAGVRQIMTPVRPMVLTKLERQMISAFTAEYLGEPHCVALFGEWLSETALDLAIRISDAAEQAARPDPYGSLPGFSACRAERNGATWHVDPALLAQIGPRMAAALVYAHQSLMDPDLPTDAGELLAMGWSPEGVAEIDGVVAFVRQMAILRWIDKGAALPVQRIP